jgi:protein subunit release factor A
MSEKKESHKHIKENLNNLDVEDYKNKVEDLKRSVKSLEKIKKKNKKITKLKKKRKKILKEMGNGRHK